MDITNNLRLDEALPDRNGHSKEDVKLLNPTKEHYGEVTALLEWLNRSFYKGDLALPMVTFRTAQKCFGVYVPEKWDHRTGTSRPEFRLNPVLLKQATFEAQCMELLRLTEHLRQAKVSRTNYHDRDYALGMKEHGLQTHREGAPEKETGERITLSVITGGKFEKLVARKIESGFSFSWSVRESEPSKEGETGNGEAAKAEGKSGRKFKYECPVEGCATAFWGKDGQKGGCFEHDPPVLLQQVD
jgi:hypothetical protein